MHSLRCSRTGTRKHHHIYPTGHILLSFGKGFDERSRHASPTYGQKPMSCRSLLQCWTLLPCIPAPTKKGWHSSDGPAEIYTRKEDSQGMKNKKRLTVFIELASICSYAFYHQVYLSSQHYIVNSFSQPPEALILTPLYKTTSKSMWQFHLEPDPYHTMTLKYVWALL